MKGYCKCGKVIDEVEFTQFGMCEKCFKSDSAHIQENLFNLFEIVGKINERLDLLEEVLKE